MLRKATAFAITMIVFSAFACSRQDQNAPSWRQHDAAISELETELKSLASEIQSSHGEGRCKFDSDCRVTGLGHETCGGYRDFLVYSALDVDEPALLALVKNFNKKATRINDLSLKVPSCGERPKKIRCIRERCNPVNN